METQTTDAPLGETPTMPRPDPASSSGLPPPERRLYRSRQDRIIGGVCGGLGHYFDVDPVLARLVALFLFFAGPGFPIYVVLWIVIPSQPFGQSEAPITASLGHDRGRELIALALVACGLLFLAGNFGLFRLVDWGLVWPALLIVGGVALLVGRNNHLAA